METSVYVFRFKGFRNHIYIYRYDPVPGVGKRSGGYCHRRMRTTQELKMYYAHKDEVRIRGKRKPHNLPTWYDDVYIADHVTYYKASSWKRNKKKKQWM